MDSQIQMLMTYHKSVLLEKSIEGLKIKPNGIYVDVTFGGGGHSRLILKKLERGRLFSFDHDIDAHQNSLSSKSFTLINANFRYIKHFLKMEGVEKIDGLLADLGVSSYQFDHMERGFSIRFDSLLDMRMNNESVLTAKEVVNTYDESQLADIFYEYGDLRQARSISKIIVNARKNKIINTTGELIDLISQLTSEKHKNKFLARVFQALRIEVNDEINALTEMLESATDLLVSRGRLVVISYHSTEDRIVKNLVKKGNVNGDLQKDFFGNKKQIFQPINKKVIVPSSEEVKANTRSRSAKLRIAEKI